MSETLCPCCGAASPAEALYCMQCGEPIRCKNCGIGILANARACIQCGTLIPERKSGDSQFAEIGLVPPGYNRLRVREKADAFSYEADLVFSDIFAQQTGTGDIITRLGGIGDRASPSRPAPQRPAMAQSVVEVAERAPTLPQLAAGLHAVELPPGEAPAGQNGAVSAEVRAIRAVFDEHEGKLTLQMSDLKAATQTDYTLRLAHMYLYARKVLFGEAITARSDVYEVTDFANLPRENVAPYLSKDGATTKSPNGESLSLNLSGLDHARRCLLEIMNPDVPAGKFTPSADGRATPNKPRKAAKRGDVRIDDAQMATLVAHSETRALVHDIPHAYMVDLQVLDKVTVALYGMHKAGMESEVYHTAMAQYLYEAFHVKVNPETIRSSLRSAMSRRNINIVYKEDEGYRITPSGIEYVETSLRRKNGQVHGDQLALMESGDE